MLPSQKSCFVECSSYNCYLLCELYRDATLPTDKIPVLSLSRTPMDVVFTSSHSVTVHSYTPKADLLSRDVSNQVFLHPCCSQLPAFCMYDLLNVACLPAVKQEARKCLQRSPYAVSYAGHTPD